MEIGPAVKEARKAHGRTQQQVADAAGVSRSAVMAMEAGRGSMRTLSAIAPVIDFRIRGLSHGVGTAAQVRNRRIRLKLTMKQFAERAGLSLATVIAVEEGRAQIGSLEKAVAAIGTNPVGKKPQRTLWKEGERDVRFTSPHIVEAIETAIGPIDCDPCWEPGCFTRPRVKAITVEECGLATKWEGRLAFMNPPFSELTTWIGRAHRAWIEGEVETVIAVAPLRADASSFHDFVFGHADLLVPRGRFHFHTREGKTGFAPYSMAFIIWGGDPAQVGALAHLLSAAWLRTMEAFDLTA